MENLKPLQKWKVKPGTDQPKARSAWEACESEADGINLLVDYGKGYFGANVTTSGYTLNVLLDPLGNFSPDIKTKRSDDCGALDDLRLIAKYNMQ